MAINASKDVVRRQRKLLSVRPINPFEAVDLIEAADASVRELTIFGRKCRPEQKLQCTRIIVHLRSYSSELSSYLVRGGEVGTSWENVETAFNRNLETGLIVNKHHLDIQNFLVEARATFVSKIEEILQRQNAIKVYTVLDAEYAIVKDGEEVIEVKSFFTETASIMATTDLLQWYLQHVEHHLPRDMEEFQHKDSGWSLRRILNLAIHINKYNPLHGSSYVDLPGPIKRKQACINVENFDNECFKWAILSALHPIGQNMRNPGRLSHYRKYDGELNFNGLSFPIAPKQVKVFEKQNDVSVNLYILENVKKNFIVAPIHITEQKKDKHVNLLLIQNYYIENEDDDSEFEPLVFHYVWIKDLSRLVHSQLSKYNGKYHICDRCLHYFQDPEKLNAHDIDCKKLNKCSVKLPEEGKNKINFNNHKNYLQVPYTVYADFECILKKVDSKGEENTKIIQIHEAHSVGYYVKCSYDESQSFYKSYRGLDPAQWLSNELVTLSHQVKEKMDDPKPMNPLTAEQQLFWRNAQTCHICKQRFLKKIEKEGDIKVRDHDHLTGEFRGAAHSKCNLRYRDALTIPVSLINT